MAISRSQTGKTMNLKPPKHLQHRVIKASSPMEKVKKKTPLLPANKKNFTQYKPKKIKAKKHLTASQLWKFAPDVKS
jgi:hypothetical protein